MKNAKELCKEFKKNVEIELELYEEKFKPTLETINERKLLLYDLNEYVKAVEYEFFTTRNFINDPTCYVFISTYTISKINFQ